jgi:glycosyltransferase involved in cell wall biosynthesis
VKFSIVITTYNRLPFLKRAIASALNQTVACEVIVVDDASTDDTEAYVRSLGDRVIYHRNATNLKHSGSVNAGVQVATGDWIKFLDDDDYLDDTCIETMMEAIARHPQAVICSCRAIQVDEEGHELYRTGTIGPSQFFYIPKEAIHYGMLLDQTPFGTPVQVAARRNIFLKAQGWNPSMTSNYDDIDAWIRIVEHGDALFLNDCLAYRTQWSGGFDQKTSIPDRLNLNISIKARIHQRVSAAYRSHCPSMDVVTRYLHLHWGLVAILQRKLHVASNLLFPACLSPQGWYLFWTIRRHRCRPSGDLVPKVSLESRGLP